MITTYALLQRGYHQSFGTMGIGHHCALGMGMIVTLSDFVNVYMDIHHLHNTNNTSAPFGMVVGHISSIVIGTEYSRYTGASKRPYVTTET